MQSTHAMTNQPGKTKIVTATNNQANQFVRALPVECNWEMNALNMRSMPFQRVGEKIVH